MYLLGTVKVFDKLKNPLFGRACYSYFTVYKFFVWKNILDIFMNPIPTLMGQIQLVFDPNSTDPNSDPLSDPNSTQSQPDQQ